MTAQKIRLFFVAVFSLFLRKKKIRYKQKSNWPILFWHFYTFTFKYIFAVCVLYRVTRNACMDLSAGIYTTTWSYCSGTIKVRGCRQAFELVICRVRALRVITYLFPVTKSLRETRLNVLHTWNKTNIVSFYTTV